MLTVVMQIEDMLTRADRCEDLADRTHSRFTSYSLREAAQQWRTMAVQMYLLEREPSYRMIRSGTE